MVMEKAFYTSTEASTITGCTRRQLQYWRRQGVVVPTVNPGGKGRNVYYSQSDLLVLTVMEYLLSRGLNFDYALLVLNKLTEMKSFEATEPWQEEKVRRMLLISGNDGIELEDFDVAVAETKLKEGFAVIPLWCDRIYEKLQHNLKAFNNSKSF